MPCHATPRHATPRPAQARQSECRCVASTHVRAPPRHRVLQVEAPACVSACVHAAQTCDARPWSPPPHTHTHIAVRGWVGPFPSVSSPARPHLWLLRVRVQPSRPAPSPAAPAALPPPAPPCSLRAAAPRAWLSVGRRSRAWRAASASVVGGWVARRGAAVLERSKARRQTARCPNAKCQSMPVSTSWQRQGPCVGLFRRVVGLIQPQCRSTMSPVREPNPEMCDGLPWRRNRVKCHAAHHADIDTRTVPRSLARLHNAWRPFLSICIHTHAVARAPRSLAPSFGRPAARRGSTGRRAHLAPGAPAACSTP